MLMFIQIRPLQNNSLMFLDKTQEEYMIGVLMCPYLFQVADGLGLK